MTDATTVCADCAADGSTGECAELFGTLLALDHERFQPWGAFHGLNVACYFLQHPSRTGELAGQWRMVTSFLAGGLDAVALLRSELVRSNRRGARPWSAFASPPARSRPATTTIEDVAVDGTFSAAGYEKRMLRWAHSVVAERPQSS